MKLLEIVVGLECREALNSVDARRDGIHKFVGGCDSGISDMFMLKFHCVTEVFAVGILDVAFVCAVVLRRCVEVPTIN
jgi:hypothetical protein